MPSISVVVRCYNEEEHIGRLLTGIEKQSMPPIEVVVVDSGSTDSTVEIASKFDGVRVVHVDREHFSFGRSLNRGCEATKGDIIVIASAHVYPVFDSWMKNLVSRLDDRRVAIAYGRQIGTPNSRYSERRLLERWFPATSTARQSHAFCNNANAAIRRGLWVDIRYDETLTGLEDLDWASRAMERGYFVSYAAEAPVVHVHREAWRQIADRYRREAIAHRRIYSDQKMPVWEAAGLALANTVSDYAHAIRRWELKGHLSEIPLFRFAQFWGTYRGFSQTGPVDETLKQRFYYPGAGEGNVISASPDGVPIHYGEDES